MMLAPLVADRKGEQAELFDELRAQGFVRVRIDGEVHEIDAPPQARPKTRKHTIEVVVDRLKARAGRRSSASPNRSRPRCATPTAARSRSRLDNGKEHSVLGEVRLPDLRLLAARARAAAVLVQQPDGRLPALRRPRRDQVLRPEARRRAPAALARRAARSAAGTGATSSTSRCSQRSPRTTASTSTRRWRSCPSACSEIVLYGSGKEKIAVPLPQRARPHASARARVRGRDPEPRAALPRDRLGRRCARSSRSTCNTRPARSATARACAREARNVKVGGRGRIYELSALPLRDGAARSSRSLELDGREAARSPRRSCARSPTGSRSSSTSASTT